MPASTVSPIASNVKLAGRLRSDPVETASSMKLGMKRAVATSSQCPSTGGEYSGHLRSASQPSTSESMPSTSRAGEPEPYVGIMKGYRIVGCEKLTSSE